MHISPLRAWGISYSRTSINIWKFIWMRAYLSVFYSCLPPAGCLETIVGYSYLVSSEQTIQEQLKPNGALDAWSSCEFIENLITPVVCSYSKARLFLNIALHIFTAHNFTRDQRAHLNTAAFALRLELPQRGESQFSLKRIQWPIIIFSFYKMSNTVSFPRMD